MRWTLTGWLLLIVACMSMVPRDVNAGPAPQNSPEIIIIPDPATQVNRFQRISPPVVVLGPTVTVPNIAVGLDTNALVAVVVTNLGIPITNFALAPLTNASGLFTNTIVAPLTNIAVAPLTNLTPTLIPGILVPQPTSRGLPLLQPGQQPILTPRLPTVIPPLRSPDQTEPMVPPLRSPGTGVLPAVPPLPPAGSR
jgi:hypothetical protein